MDKYQCLVSKTWLSLITFVHTVFRPEIRSSINIKIYCGLKILILTV